MMGLTRRMRDCHLIIQDLVDAGASPTLKALMHEGGWCVSDASRLVNALIERGWLRRDGQHQNSPLQILIRLQPPPDFRFTVTPEGVKAVAHE